MVVDYTIQLVILMKFRDFLRIGAFYTTGVPALHWLSSRIPGLEGGLESIVGNFDPNLTKGVAVGTAILATEAGRRIIKNIGNKRLYANSVEPDSRNYKFTKQLAQTGAAAGLLLTGAAAIMIGPESIADTFDGVLHYGNWAAQQIASVVGFGKEFLQTSLGHYTAAAALVAANVSGNMKAIFPTRKAVESCNLIIDPAGWAKNRLTSIQQIKSNYLKSFTTDRDRVYKEDSVPIAEINFIYGGQVETYNFNFKTASYQDLYRLLTPDDFEFVLSRLKADAETIASSDVFTLAKSLSIDDILIAQKDSRAITHGMFDMIVNTYASSSYKDLVTLDTTDARQRSIRMHQLIRDANLKAVQETADFSLNAFSANAKDNLTSLVLYFKLLVAKSIANSISETKGKKARLYGTMRTTGGVIDEDETSAEDIDSMVEDQDLGSGSGGATLNYIREIQPSIRQRFFQFHGNHGLGYSAQIQLNGQVYMINQHYVTSLAGLRRKFSIRNKDGEKIGKVVQPVISMLTNPFHRMGVVDSKTNFYISSDVPRDQARNLALTLAAYDVMLSGAMGDVRREILKGTMVYLDTQDPRL
jgi:hypothetical protein